MVLVAYPGALIPMNRLAGYRIYRIDDLEAYNAEATEYMRRLTQYADMLISPYAYELPKFFPHPNIRWVPDSSAVEEEAGPPSFNDEPIAKGNYCPAPSRGTGRFDNMCSVWRTTAS